MIIRGDCLEQMKLLEANSVDSIVTDPPYGLSFMNKKWDYDVPDICTWKEALRVLKPGGHLLSFGGTRTYHRMVVAIEDAGFEIRDSLQWLQGQGFPKSLDVRKAAIKAQIACGCEEIPQHDMRPLPDADVQAPVDTQDKCGQVLHDSLSQQGSSELRSQGNSDVRRDESMLEGRQLHRAGEGLSNDPNAEASSSQTERICPRTHSDSGENAGTSVATTRRDSSHQSRPFGQSSGEPESLCDSPRALDGTSFPRCPKCARPIFPQGIGTALKPAVEIICLARKPLEKGLTIAENVLKYGTGGLNIEVSRVETSDNLNGGAYSKDRDARAMSVSGEYPNGTKPNVKDLGQFNQPQGRFPANIILDEVSAEMLDEQSGNRPSRGAYIDKTHQDYGKSSMFGFGGLGTEDKNKYANEQGGASRFFYVAKASKRERGEGNVHPTVKPIRLMEYLIKLITPTNGTVLDPFMGSGSTGVAAKRLGFGFIGIEMNDEYAEIADQRITNA